MQEDAISVKDSLKDKIHWHQFAGSSISLALAQKLISTTGVHVIIVKDNNQCVKLEREIKAFWGDNSKTIYHFPDWEILPYDHFSPHQDITSERILTLTKLPDMTDGIIITTITTIMHYLMPVSYLKGRSLMLDVNETLNIDEFRKKAVEYGYMVVKQVFHPGEFTVRGSIIDIFPMGSKHPIRIDLFDDVIDSIRTFDTETQKSTGKLPYFHVLPAKEFPLEATSIRDFRNRFREAFRVNPSNCPIYEGISEGHTPHGIEYYIPLFFENVSTFFDYLPETATIIQVGDIYKAADTFSNDIKTRFEHLSHDITKPLLPPTQLFLESNEIFGHLKAYNQIILKEDTHDKGVSFSYEPLPDIAIDRKLKEPLEKLISFSNKHPDARVLFVAETIGRRETLFKLLSHGYKDLENLDSWHAFYKSDVKVGLIAADIEQGFFSKKDNLIFITEFDLFGHQVLQRRLRTKISRSPHLIIRDLAELEIGDTIVHEGYGIGSYQGLKTLTADSITNEFITIHYADNDIIYVPITSLNLISRYSTTEKSATTLSRLGSDKWAKTKARVTGKIRDTATELLDIYAKRAARVGITFNEPTDDYYAFVSAFAFEETPDQIRAVNEIIEDMTSALPMDRLVCGDVGFGKTEVAMRAAFLAVLSGKQVIVLVPTTLLASQHTKTFKDRFAEFGVEIALMSRFSDTKENLDNLAKLKSGAIDIIIGTHKVLGVKNNLKDLGLLIIDEEHRFGVRQKEHFKALRSDVDILTLTATPIPRTLNLSMIKLRDISIIQTPPKKRLSIKTFKMMQNNGVIKEALLREIKRGGQVFYLHNKVQSIERVYKELERLVPEAKINYAHGQMPKLQLEKIMHDFYHQQFNVLVCTTIIENGIDIPSANTIVIDHAQNFGLAQLHQLRGRVGRSHHQAYAYLITPDDKLLTPDAKKRLSALLAMEDLGAGFMLATQDLEIRGAGDILGEEQSGNIHAIGFNFYMELLDKTIASLKDGDEKDVTPKLTCEIDLKIPAFIPDTYIHDTHIRLMMYKRIAGATDDTLDEIQVELIDRFGLLPDEAKCLFEVATLKERAQRLKIKRLDFNKIKGRIDFYENPNVSIDKLLRLVQSKSEYTLLGPESIGVQHGSVTPADRIAFVASLLAQFE